MGIKISPSFSNDKSNNLYAQALLAGGQPTSVQFKVPQVPFEPSQPCPQHSQFVQAVNVVV